jgi:hypothetical protein
METILSDGPIVEDAGGSLTIPILGATKFELPCPRFSLTSISNAFLQGGVPRGKS